MCEHCGCPALQTIDELTREHDAALGHVRTAEHAVAVGLDGAPLREWSDEALRTAVSAARAAG